MLLSYDLLELIWQQTCVIWTKVFNLYIFTELNVAVSTKLFQGLELEQCHHFDNMFLSKQAYYWFGQFVAVLTKPITLSGYIFIQNLIGFFSLHYVGIKTIKMPKQHCSRKNGPIFCWYSLYQKNLELYSKNLG